MRRARSARAVASWVGAVARVSCVWMPYCGVRNPVARGFGMLGPSKNPKVPLELSRPEPPKNNFVDFLKGAPKSWGKRHNKES